MSSAFGAGVPRLGARTLGRLGILAVACVVAGAVVGAAWHPKPPGRPVATIRAADPGTLLLARVPVPSVTVGPDVTVSRQPFGGGTTITVPAASPADARAQTEQAAQAYVQAITKRQDQILRVYLAQNPHGKLARARTAALNATPRYDITYQVLAGGGGSGVASAAIRQALIGLLVAALAAALFMAAAPPLVETGPLGAALRWLGEERHQGATIVGAAALTVGITLVTTHTSAAVYTAALVALMVAWGFALARLEAAGIRLLVLIVVVTAVLRGALIGIADAISLPNATLTVNAIAPALVAGSAVALIIQGRKALQGQSRALLIAWGLIAGSAVLDLATQTVGLKLYVIGLAQYLTFPTLVIVAWPFIRRRDSERFSWLLVAMGVLVSASIFLEAAHLVHFVEAVSPTRSAGLGLARYGGSTGSFLHASIFLGTIGILAIGIVLARWRERAGIAAAGALTLTLGAGVMTVSRGGFVILAIGAIVLLIASDRVWRIRLVAVTLGAAVVALVIGLAGGVTPSDLGSRVKSGVEVSGTSDVNRIDAMRNAVDTFGNLPLDQQIFGEGLAATGNAGKLVRAAPNPTESYPLKLLLEVGVIGLLAIGGFLVWATVKVGRIAFRTADAYVRSIAAAALALSLYCLVYPTLEAQVLAATWWLLLAISLKAASRGRGGPATERV